MKNIYSVLFLTMGLALSAQIGIKTEQPKATLDVNGDFNLRGKMTVLTPSNGSISEGGNDRILVSQGEGYPPVWKSLRIPEYEPNKFYLIFNNSFSDRTGVRFTASENSTITSRADAFTKNKVFSSLNGFKKIAGLNQKFNVFSSQSKAYFQFETVVQANFDGAGNTDVSVDYACGIFVDDKLINLRQGNLKAINSTNPFLTHNQIGIIENLSVGEHSVSVGCSRLKSYNTNNQSNSIVLGIGRAVSDNIDGFISQSSLRVDVYEIPQVFNTIIN